MMARRETPYNYESVAQEEAANQKAKDYHKEQQRQQTPPKHEPVRDPIHVTAAYLVAYLGTFPKEKKDQLMKVAKAFMPYLGSPQREEPVAVMRDKVKQKLSEMERILSAVAELRTIAESYDVLTIEDVMK